MDSRFVTLNDPVLGERYYHELHFFCSECGDPFLDPSKSSAPGTEGLGNDEESETNPFVIQRGHPYCERCHVRLHKPKCKACKQPIPDVAVQAMGVKWHQECFVCSVCQPAARDRKKLTSRNAINRLQTVSSSLRTERLCVLYVGIRSPSFIHRHDHFVDRMTCNES